jgi:2,3-bisphosphoglycerate-dependent phosphoglycerate mutase
MLPSSTTTLSHRLAAPDLWLVRHGESTWNTLGLIQGHRDDAVLTARGAEQAAAVAEQFRSLAVSALYSSDLRRALQTAAAFAEVVGLPVTQDARLRERSLGMLEGTPLAAASPAVTGVDAGQVTDPDARPQHGETIRDFYHRAAAFCHDLVRQTRLTAGDVLVIAHGGTLRVLHAYLSGVPVEQMRWEPLENARVLRIDGFGTQVFGGTE